LPEQTRAYQTFSPAQPSNLLFDKPVQGPLSSPFGLRRFFNGEERNPTPASTSRSEPALHQGTSRWQGHPHRQLLLQRQYGVRRPRPGPHQHVLSHVEGGRETGPEPARGGIVGRVGATGRATGPHMHWNVSLNDARVDPAIFIGAFKP
jgi:murein DD-endopeptidase MepM/ murein hydrolase activator NlpD